MFQLFELLGPEGFEMIERLLQRRADVVDSLLSSLPDQRLSHLPGELHRGHIMARSQPTSHAPTGLERKSGKRENRCKEREKVSV